MKAFIIELAFKACRRSSSIYRVGAVIFKGKRVVSIGSNIKRNVRSINRRFVKWPTSIHAEVCAIINAKQNLKGYSLLVVRLDRAGNMSLAKPCKHCQGYIRYVGIKKIYYSTKNGITLMKLD